MDIAVETEINYSFTQSLPTHSVVHSFIGRLVESIHIVVVGIWQDNGHDMKVGIVDPILRLRNNQICLATDYVLLDKIDHN